MFKTWSTLKYDNNIIKSNYLTIVSPMKKYFKENLDCSTPYWRNH